MFAKLLLSLVCVVAVGSAIAEEKDAVPKVLSPESMKCLLKEMVWVEGGSYSMGSNSDKASSAEGPAHKVTLAGC